MPVGIAEEGVHATPDPAWLILSSAYVGQELAAEFGQLPPAFLPLGVRRLYEYQFEILPERGDFYLTIPEDFELPPVDRAAMEKRGVTLLALPKDLSLGEAVVHALGLIGAADRPVKMLHGDTCIRGIDPGLDLIAIAQGAEGYSWAEVEMDRDRVAALRTLAAGQPGERDLPVSVGYFAFGSSALLARSILGAGGNFIDGINRYGRERRFGAARPDGWLDFGHLRTFYRSRRAVTTARAFNSLEITEQSVRKFSIGDTGKIKAEAAWLRSVPPPIKPFTVRLLDAGTLPDGVPFYDTEYEYLPTVSELFVFGRLDRPSWDHVFRSCSAFLSGCFAFPAEGAEEEGALAELAIAKTIERLEAFARDRHFPIDAELRLDGRPMPSLIGMASRLGEEIARADRVPPTIMHGDFCFSNILYNARVRRIRALDPRGRISEQAETIFGDVRYDLAKLAHSAIGRYDQIIAGRYTARQDGLDFSIALEAAPHHFWVEDAFRRMRIGPISAQDRLIYAIMLTLFLSMLPLHADRPDRQTAFIANALRLYDALETIA